MTAEVIEAKAFHSGRMARALRVKHRDILQAMGVHIHREMRDTFDASMWRRALLVDGELLAIGGITGSMSSAEGMVWIAVSESALAHPHRIAREALRQIEQLMIVKRRLLTIVMTDDPAAINFADFLGFRVEKPTSINGAAALVMIYDRSPQEVS